MIPESEPGVNPELQQVCHLKVPQIYDIKFLYNTVKKCSHVLDIFSSQNSFCFLSHILSPFYAKSCSFFDFRILYAKRKCEKVVVWVSFQICGVLSPAQTGFFQFKVTMAVSVTMFQLSIFEGDVPYSLCTMYCVGCLLCYDCIHLA